MQRHLRPTALVLVVVAFTLAGCPPPPTAQPSGATTTSATEGPAGLNADERELQSHVPEAFRETCESMPVDDQHAVAAVACYPTGAAGEVPDQVNYALYSGNATMDEVFDTKADTIDAVEGECATDDHVFGTYYLPGGETIGRVLCGKDESGAAIIWTDERLYIMASAIIRGPDADPEPLYDWWTANAIEEATETAIREGRALGPDERELQSHVPEAFRDTCESTQGAYPEDVIAVIFCYPEGAAGEVPDTLGYQQWASTEAMNAQFDRNVDVAAAVEGDCETHDNVYGAYAIGGEEVGQVLCTLDERGTAINWTDERLDIFAAAAIEGADADSVALYEWWLGDSGPVE